MSGMSRAFAVCSDVGVVREHNEDYAVAMDFRPSGGGESEPILLAAVADGMGGHAAGEVASRAAVDTFIQAAMSALSDGDASEPNLLSALEEAFGRANEEVYYRGHNEGAESRGMGTTLTAALIWKHRLCVGHVGDSRAYLIRQGEVRQLTRDHSIVQEKIAAGLLTPEEATYSDERNQLRRALGSQPEVLSDILHEDLQEGDVIVLSTDGLHSSITKQDLSDAVLVSPNAQTACERLVGLARARDGSDNITAVCIGVGSAAFPALRNRLAVPKKAALRKIIGSLLVLTLMLITLTAVQLLRRPAVVTTPPHLESQSSSKKATIAPDSANLLIGLPLRMTIDIRDGQAEIRLSRAAPLRINIGDDLVYAKGKSISPNHLPIVTQQIDLSLLPGDTPNSINWTLSRSLELTRKSKRGLWIDDRRKLAATSLQAISRGTALQPKRSIMLNLAGAQIVPVKISIESQSTKASSDLPKPKKVRQTKRTKRPGHSTKTPAGEAPKPAKKPKADSATSAQAPGSATPSHKTSVPPVPNKPASGTESAPIATGVPTPSEGSEDGNDGNPQ